MTPTMQAWIMTPTIDWGKMSQKVQYLNLAYLKVQKIPYLRQILLSSVHLSLVKLMIPDISPFSRQTQNSERSGQK